MLKRNGGTALPHGSEEMPVWGPLFWKVSQGHPAEDFSALRTAWWSSGSQILAKYLETFQAK
jgi:hypothetical protein